MKLLNSLYTITSKEESATAVRYDIRLDASHVIYQAHFPGEPITPGVCIIQIAKELLEEHVGRSLAIEKVKNVKFLSVISPVTTPDVTCILEKIVTSESDDSCRVQVQIMAGEQAMAKLSFTCSPS